MSKKIKILFILDGFPSISTPFIINQMIGIVKDGHNLTILSRHKGNLDIIHKEVKNFNLLSKTVFFPPLNESKTARIKYFFKNLHLFFGKHSYKYWNSLNPVKHGKYALSLRLFYETSGFLRLPTLDYDIIHGQFGPLGLMAVRQRRNKTISGRIITQFRGYDISKLFQFEPSNYYNELFKEGDWFLANCNFFAQKAIDKGAPKNKISVQYSGIQTDKFTHPKNDFSINDGLKIVTVGRLAPKKGVKYILQALGKIKQDNLCDFSYHLIGDGPLKEELYQLARELNIDKQVYFEGKQNHDYIIEKLPQFDLFISHNITAEDGDQDAPVNTIKEAMLSGLPVISTFHGGIPEMIDHKENGYLVEEKNVDQLAEAIQYVVKNPKIVNSWIDKGKKSTIEKFDNDMLNRRLIEIYKKVLEENPT